MTNDLDLNSYFNRIQWMGEPRPDLNTLTGILGAHMMTIPFENLDVLLGRRIHLDLPRLQNKLVTSKRGGYCFEHATLLAAVLEKIGFQLTRHTARVTVMEPYAQAPRTHMFLAVTLSEGTFVVDPGFGGFGPRVPVPLRENSSVSVANEKHWMTREGRYWTLNFQNGETALKGWVTAMDDDNIIDFEVGNHFTSTHPDSFFRTLMMLAIRTPDGRVTALDRDATIRKSKYEQTLKLEDRKALRKFLLEHFKFDFPEAEQIRIASCPEWN